MFYFKIYLIFLCFLNITYCDWVSDWMAPVQEQLRRTAARRIMNDEVQKMIRIDDDPVGQAAEVVISPRPKPEDNMSLKAKLEATLNNAEELIEKLQMEIFAVESKERRIKDAIANGRTGVSAVTVSNLDGAPRLYLVREGVWSFCKGMIQYPSIVNPAQQSIFNDVLSEPRCIGAEISAKQDPCVFNSVIKYEVIPERRKLEYVEEDYFCLKPMFNKSLENYHSVPRKIVSDTCNNGMIRNLQDHTKMCTMRTMAEYTYYPKKPLASTLYPLEYCKEKDGSCKMIIAWHVSNTTVENFEFLKSDSSFKKYFISAGKPARQMLLEEII